MVCLKGTVGWLLYNSKGRANRAEEFGHAELSEEWVSKQHKGTDQIISFQDY